MTALSHGSAETVAAKEPSSNLAPIRCSPERVHLSAQLLTWAFPGVWGALAEQQWEHRRARVEMTSHPSGALCVWG